jgi:GT2 family glycosyltransferase
MTRVTAVLTSFNRREQTLQCLARLQAAAQQAGCHVDVVLVDDASRDGTAAAVRQAHPQAQVIDGPGNLYWNRGMHLGMQHALQQPVDHLLWLNDDTLLHPHALAHLLAEQAALQARHGRPVLLVGSTADAEGRITYGGAVAASGLRRFSFRRVSHASEPQPCQAVNGNCVLLPWALVQAVGNLDPRFEHAMGDTDYALRTHRAGFPVYVASGVVGVCGHNSLTNTYLDTRLSLPQRWRRMMDRKGLPWRSWLHFTRRHGGALWPLYFAWPYLRVVLGRAPR